MLTLMMVVVGIVIGLFLGRRAMLVVAIGATVFLALEAFVQGADGLQVVANIACLLAVFVALDTWKIERQFAANERRRMEVVDRVLVEENSVP